MELSDLKCSNCFYARNLPGPNLEKLIDCRRWPNPFVKTRDMYACGEGLWLGKWDDSVRVFLLSFTDMQLDWSKIELVEPWWLDVLVAGSEG